MPHRNLIEISATISRTMPVSSYVGNYEELEYLFNRCRCGGALSITPHIIINVGYHNVARAIRTCSLLHFTNYIVYLFVYDMHSQPARRIIKKKRNHWRLVRIESRKHTEFLAYSSNITLSGIAVFEWTRWQTEINLIYAHENSTEIVLIGQSVSNGDLKQWKYELPVHIVVIFLVLKFLIFFLLLIGINIRFYFALINTKQITVSWLSCANSIDHFEYIIIQNIWVSYIYIIFITCRFRIISHNKSSFVHRDQ